ncbi:hypothetical protein RRG08_047201 [Elysia crispata]|uniref:Uncharacterized protein n=1 Tax=Elysia crispata TaxID=231223 RepID=A0AAE1EEA4_9GAST|nr:hypothetical protein RRG08_047201 [Elysia crispata]
MSVEGPVFSNSSVLGCYGGPSPDCRALAGQDKVAHLRRMQVYATQRRHGTFGSVGGSGSYKFLLHEIWIWSLACGNLSTEKTWNIWLCWGIRFLQVSCYMRSGSGA